MKTFKTQAQRLKSLEYFYFLHEMGDYFSESLIYASLIEFISSYQII
jgi:hypothetical protein